MVFRIYLQEMVQDNEKHGGASKEYCERVELAIGYHIGCEACLRRGKKDERLCRLIVSLKAVCG